MSKYVKKVNWPWVEVDDGFEGEDTITINMDRVSTIWPRVNGHYHYGIRYKDGGWFEFLSKEALQELQELVISRKVVKTSFNLPGSLPIDTELELMHEEQTMQEWLEENGQA